jgi:putative membrane protein
LAHGLQFIQNRKHVFINYEKEDKSMWECANFQFFSGMGGIFPGGIFSILLWGLIILALVYLGSRIFKSMKAGPNSVNKDRNDSLEMLKLRYAKGDINQDEYFKMKNTLGQESKA